ncbi:MAG: MYG1 family protein, partial [Sulfitobacter sp.]|nr:MYG1 family protein [Sulfitobacter sp.]
TDIDDIHSSFDTGFVLPIDLVDNGDLAPAAAGQLAGLTLPALLGTLKPVFDDRSPDADDRAFAAALPIARAFIEGSIAGKAAKRRAEATVLEAITQAGPSRVLELPMGMPFRKAIETAGADHLLFVVHPRDSDWAITGIRLSGDGFEQRADLPAAWAGLTDDALEAACGVKGAKFCHNGLFIAVASTREAAVEMADLAVKDAV